MGRNLRCSGSCGGKWIYQAAVCTIGLLWALLGGTTSATACTDFGDALGVNYPTLLADDGARHEIRSGPILGLLIDGEPDGHPTPTATGDDFDATNDEDGIVFTSPLVVDQLAFLTITVTGVGFLNAWIDFNADGDWSDAGEQIFTDEYLVDGPSLRDFNVPAYAALGETGARFRLDSDGGLAPSGLARDGEVEDYLVSITAVPEPATLPLLTLGQAGLVGVRRRGGAQSQPPG